MARIKTFKAGTTYDFGDYYDASNDAIAQATATQFVLTSGSARLQITGTGFVYRSTGPVAGTVTALTLTDNGTQILSLDQLSLSLAQLYKLLGDQAAFSAFLFGGNDSFAGTSSADYVTGFGGADSLVGGAGDDVLSGEAGNDYLRGDAGDDSLRGGAGNDTASGGDGADQIYGDAGDDRLYGGADSDMLAGGSGNDRLIGARDTVYGGVGDDRIFSDELFTDAKVTVYGGDGNDSIHVGGIAYGEDGNDTLIGWRGHDLLEGGAGNDSLSGQDYTDMAAGTTVQDTLSGGVGDDTLVGYNNDLLYGGDGADKLTGSAFAYGEAGNDTIIAAIDANFPFPTGGILDGGAGDDVISGALDGFTVDVGIGTGKDTVIAGVASFDILHFGANDLLDLSAIDADPNTAGNQAFTYVGAKTFSQTAGELRFDAATHALSGDIDGDGYAEFTLNLIDTTSLSAASNLKL
jgi:Ca2+-binding RTX toxin-like protein